MRKGPLIASLCVACATFCAGQTGFKESQQAFPRVREAYREKWEVLEQKLQSSGLDPGRLELYLRAYKQEKEVEVWARNRGEEGFQPLCSYAICRMSGLPGPKRRQGDLQIPEGFYHIHAYNPWSNFHLSFCINYPNPSDRVLGKRGNLGGDICIHGDCVTIGCLPLTDEVIKELYILCVEAKNSGQERIPVTIYPAKMSLENFERLKESYSHDQDRMMLWSELRIAYDLFQSSHRLPVVAFLPDGRHSIR